MIWKIMFIHQSHESQFRQFRRESKGAGPGTGRLQSDLFRRHPFILSLSKDARSTVTWFDMVSLSNHHHERLGMNFAIVLAPEPGRVAQLGVFL